MDLKTSILIALFLILFFGTVCFGIYVWLKKSIYTRERFAFAGLAAASTLTILVISCIYYQDPPWIAVIDLIKNMQGLPYEPKQPITNKQWITSIGLVFGMWWLIFSLHRNWNGAKSFNQHEQDERKQKPSLISDSLLVLSPTQNKHLLTIYNSDNNFRLSALEGVATSLIWRDQARDLLTLSDRKYDFPLEEWHDQGHCWIGTHQGTGATVVLACHEDNLDAVGLDSLAHYAEKVKNNISPNSKGLEFIIALKNGDIDEYSHLWEYKLRTVSESHLLDKLIDFSNYFYDLRKRVETDTLTGSNLTLNDVYTISRFKLDKEGVVQPDLEKYLNDWLDESSRRQIALLGEYGQGKSTASLMLSYRLMQRCQQNIRSARIPIMFELRGKSPRTLREDELLSTWAGRYGIDTRALMKLLIAGRILLIFEGFDEVDLSGDVDARIEHFKVMWGLCYPKAKILVTGRPNYFLDDVELKAALGIQDPSLERPYCQAMFLAPFGMNEISNSLRKLDPDTRKGIMDLAHANERFNDIVSRPSLLHVVGTLWHRENLAQYGDRISSALIMDLFVRNSLERQASKAQKYDFTPPMGGNAKPSFMALNTHERAYFMEGIAVYMLINQLPNQISAKQLESAVRLLIDAIPESVTLKADAQSGESRKPLRQRYDLKNKPEEVQTILTDVRACGLLVPDLSRSGSFKFGHKSFMEFLAGKAFAQWTLRKELHSDEEKYISSLVNQLGLKMLHVVLQQEVMAFAVEWIADKAKNQNEAAKAIFDLLFRQHSYFRKFVGIICKLSLKQLYYFKDSFLLDYFYIINNKIFYEYQFSSLYRFTKAFSVFVGLASGVSIVFSGKLYINTLLNHGLLAFTQEIVLILLGVTLVAVTMLFCFITLTLIEGYKSNDDNSFIWIEFRAWQAICAAAHLDRSALAGVIGEKSLSLLEAVTNREPRPWSIPESLEKLKVRVDDMT